VRLQHISGYLASRRPKGRYDGSPATIYRYLFGSGWHPMTILQRIGP